MKPAKKTDAELKGAETRFEFASQFSGALVFIGLLIEVWGAVEYRPAGVSLTQTWEPAVSGVLVAVGVFFEIMFSRWSLQQSAELRQRAEHALAEATERAGKAIERAAAAELETERLRKSVGARFIDEPIFLAELADKPCPLEAIIFHAKGIGGDGWHISLQLETLLHKAGWRVSLFGRWPLDLSDPRFEAGPAVVRDGPTAGIRLRTPYGPGSGPGHEQSNALAQALMKTLGGMVWGQAQDVKPGTLEVVIFPRP